MSPQPNYMLDDINALIARRQLARQRGVGASDDGIPSWAASRIANSETAPQSSTPSAPVPAVTPSMDTASPFSGVTVPDWAARRIQGASNLVLDTTKPQPAPINLVLDTTKPQPAPQLLSAEAGTVSFDTNNPRAPGSVFPPSSTSVVPENPRAGLFASHAPDLTPVMDTTVPPASTSAPVGSVPAHTPNVMPEAAATPPENPRQSLWGFLTGDQNDVGPDGQPRLTLSRLGGAAIEGLKSGVKQIPAALEAQNVRTAWEAEHPEEANIGLYRDTFFSSPENVRRYGELIQAGMGEEEALQKLIGEGAKAGAQGAQEAGQALEKTMPEDERYAGGKSSGMLEGAVRGTTEFAPSLVASAVNPILGLVTTTGQLAGGHYEQFKGEGAEPAWAAQAAYGYIKKSIELAMNKEVDGVATAPIQKEAIHRAGIPYIGHTEMFKGLTHSDHALTMFHVNKMRIFFLTRHLSLVKACEYVTYDHVLEYIRDCAKAMKQLGLGDGRMALAALNPHGGEKGLCGDEEEIALKPAALQAQKEGINVFGPIPADSVFRLFELDKCEAVLSLYHDQGHIAAKVHDLLKTVSVTVGLPFIRTSVDHGTAFDIAGKGIVSSKSMEESILVTGMYIDLVRKSEQAK